MFRKLRRLLRDPYYEVGKEMLAKHPSLMSDKWWTSVVWKEEMGYELDWNHPCTFNEKLQWLKIHDHNPLYTRLVDKIEVKKWVAERIGEEYIIPTLAVWERAEDIDITNLPDKFVLKCNHDSGSTVICYDNGRFDLEEAKRKLGRALRCNYYNDSREWPYKHVTPKILAEQYIEPSTGVDLPDYKFFVFDGKARYLFVATDRQSETEETKFDFFDIKFNHLNITNGHSNSLPVIPPKPCNYDLMVELAEKLCAEIPHVRCDFYEVDGKVYFGEMTFYHWSGFVPFNPHSFDVQMGELLKLPIK